MLNTVHQLLHTSSTAMNIGKKARLGAILAFVLCGVLTTPTGDPLSMIINGATGAAVTFPLLWWIFSRPATASWSERRQTVFAMAISGCVTLIMVALIAIFLVPDKRVIVTTLTLREKQAATTTFHGYYIVEGLTNNVSGTLPATFTFHSDVRSIHYEFVCDEPAPREIELVVSSADGSTSTSLWKKRISGISTWRPLENGDYERRHESYIDSPLSAVIHPHDRP
jgi:hypothetical protein